MVTWLDLLVGLLPFTLIAMLLWMRLCAAGVSKKVAMKFIAEVFVLIAIAILGLICFAKGWHRKSSLLLIAGTIVTVASVFALRQSLQRMWEKTPLPSGENRRNGENDNQHPLTQ